MPRRQAKHRKVVDGDGSDVDSDSDIDLLDSLSDLDFSDPLDSDTDEDSSDPQGSPDFENVEEEQENNPSSDGCPYVKQRCVQWQTGAQSQELGEAHPTVKQKPVQCPTGTQPQGSSWRDVTEFDEHEQHLPQFTPTRTPGVHLDSSENWTPLKLFQLFITPKLVESIVSRTKAYHQRMRATSSVKYNLPKALGVESFYRFLGVLFYMGLVKLPQIHDYWSPGILGQRFIHKCGIARYFFDRVLWSLHFSTEEEDREMAEKRSEGQPYDNLTKIRLVVEEVAAACKKYMAPQREIFVNEKIVAFKSQYLNMKQYLPGKPIRYGYKMWVIACPKTGYTFNFYVHTGKKIHSEGIREGLGLSVFKELSEDYLDCGHLVYVDTFYTTQQLFEYLLTRKTLAVGAVRESRQGYPRHALNPLTLKDTGKIRWCRNGVVVYINWVEFGQIIKMASTFHLGHEVTEVTRKKQPDDTRKKRSRLAGPTVVRPKAVSDFNAFMGGADSSDQLVLNFAFRKRRDKSHHRQMFLHCVHLAVMNAFILYKQVNKVEKPWHMTHKTFIESLIEEIWDTYSAVPLSALWLRQKKTVVVHRFFKKEGNTRKTCRVCSRKTFMACKECGDLPMCVIATRNCFVTYHTQRNVPFAVQ